MSGAARGSGWLRAALDSDVYVRSEVGSGSPNQVAVGAAWPDPRAPYVLPRARIQENGRLPNRPVSPRILLLSLTFMLVRAPGLEPGTS